MKHIHIRFILSVAIVAFSQNYMGAQEVAELETDSLNAADPSVQIAFRKVAESDLTGGVSVINMQELNDKNYSTYSLDNLQGYVGGWNGNSLWGMDGDNAGYLVLVDGVPRDADNVLPSEIEQITFLKSASAVVLYGSRASKGVIYITTKRGKEQEKLQIDVRANTGFYVPKSYPKYLGSAEYMTLYNEALANDGLDPLYSDTEIYNYASGANPYRYPNVDYYSSDYLKKAYNRSDVTAEFSGGNKRARFYSNIGYYRQSDIFNFGEVANNYTGRLNIRGNVDVTINDDITAFANANATFYDTRSGRTTYETEDGETYDYWTEAASMRPNRFAPLIPLSYIDPNSLAAQTLMGTNSNIFNGYFLGGSQVDQRNIFADYYAAGYNKYTSRQFQFDTGLDFKLDKLLKGLSFHFLFAVDYATSYNTSYDNEYRIYTPTWSNYNGSDLITDFTYEGTDKKTGQQTISGSTDNQTIALSAYFDYKTTVNKVHNLSAMFIVNGFQQTYSGVYHRTSNANLGIQLGYNYKGKYYADFSGAAVHSAKLAEGHRNAFSPALTLAWKLHEEDFLKDSPMVDELMLNVSGSILHQDIDLSDYYMYAANYTQADGAWWGWHDGTSLQSTNSIHGANEDLTFVKRKEFTAGLRTSLWNRLVTADANFFINSVEGLPIQSTSLFPSYFSTYYPEASFVPYVNYNNNKRIGFDFAVNFNKKVGEADLSLGVTGTYYNTEITQRDENNEYEYQNRVGKPIDGIWGLECLGFFESDEDVANSPTQNFGGTVRKGDLKYKDQNGDGVIDSKDEVYLGRGAWYGSPFTLGLNFTAKWKNFTFFALGTGGFGGYGMKSSSYYWVYGDGKYSEVVRGRWTEETAATATYPRLTTQTGDNNFRNSTFWLYKTNRFDLAKVQLTYDFPKRLLQKTFLKEAAVYVSGSNLLTIAKERELLEMNVGSAPQTRFYNLGVKIAF